jgi:hypothetical protein
MMEAVGPRHRLACQLSLLAVIGLMLGACAGGRPARTPVAALALLTCDDSAGQQGIDAAPALLVNGVDGFLADTNAYDTLPVRRQGGHRYLGGIFVTHPACVTFAVAGPAGKPGIVTIPVLVARC